MTTKKAPVTTPGKAPATKRVHGTKQSREFAAGLFYSIQHAQKGNKK